jgi:predicted Rossmann fold nucleotide-binding protein DprA/Smf involved in DNA uptake
MADISEKSPTPDATKAPAKGQSATVQGGSGAMSQKILGLIGDGEIDIDQLVRLTGASSEHLLVQCARLEIDGSIIATASGYRRRIS